MEWLVAAASVGVVLGAAVAVTLLGVPGSSMTDPLWYLVVGAGLVYWAGMIYWSR